MMLFKYLYTLYLRGKAGHWWGGQREKVLVSAPCWYALLRYTKTCALFRSQWGTQWQWQWALGDLILTSSGLYNCSFQLHIVVWATALVKAFFFIQLHFQIHFRIPFSSAWAGLCLHSALTLTLQPPLAKEGCQVYKHQPSQSSRCPHPHPLTAFVFISAFHWISHIPFPCPADAEM